MNTRLPSRRAQAVLVAVIAVVLGSATGVAFAFWTTVDSTHNAVATADSLPAGATPSGIATTPAANSSTVGLTFSTTARTAGGATVTSYLVRRYATGSSTVSASFTCTPPAGAFTCTEASVPDGSWQYTDAPVVAGSLWQGAESARSGSVRVDTTSPTSTIAFPAAGGAYNASAWSGGCNVAPFSAAGSICGTATDPGSSPSGVSAVNVSIRSTSGTTNGLYWGGSSFSAATEQTFAATYSSGNWTYPFPAANFPDGTFTVRSYATDAAGNTQTAATTTGFTIDTTAPAVSAPAASAGTTFGSSPLFVNNETVSLTEAATDAGSGVKTVSYYLCPGATGACTAATPWTLIGTSSTSTGGFPVTSSAPLAADGAYRLVAVATDNANNTSGSSAATLVTVDTTPPTVSRPTVNGHS